MWYCIKQDKPIERLSIQRSHSMTEGLGLYLESGERKNIPEEIKDNVRQSDHGGALIIMHKV